MIPARSHITAMAPYALAKMQPPEGKSLVSLAQNESFRPPSPRAIKAATMVLHDAAAYPDPDWHDLRNALAARHGISRDAVLCGAGSLELIGCLARVYAGPNRAVLAPEFAYPFFRSATQMADARFDTAPEIGTTASVDTLLDAVKPDTGVVFIANPGNPTGTRISRSELIRLRNGLRDDILLVIDEAYGEFADHLNEPMFDLVTRGDTVVLRTFSKAYGLAGCRVGWGVFPPAIVGEMRKVMNPNNISTATQASARAALEDQTYMRETCAMLDATKGDARKRLRATGISVEPSFTNFLLLDFGAPALADKADALLRAKGIFLRGQAGVGLPQCLRMTIGPTDDVAAALAVLEEHNWEDRA